MGKAKYGYRMNEVIETPQMRTRKVPEPLSHLRKVPGCAQGHPAVPAGMA